MKRLAIIVMITILLALPAWGLSDTYNADVMQSWLLRFCQALSGIEMLGDPAQTTDPARPGEYLLEYAFGTVLASKPADLDAHDILEIDVRSNQVTDCRGMRVGMTLQDVLAGSSVGRSSTQLYVLSTQASGMGFAWAYLSGNSVYGVEYITFSGEEAAVKKYTQTYVIDENGVVSAIRIRCAQTTQALAKQDMDTAQEIAQRQSGEVFAVKNDAPALRADELTLMGVPVLGLQTASLVSALGEPVEIQALTGGRGRILLYEGAAVELGLDEMTGEEVVRGVHINAGGAQGPRGLSVGMSVQEAASLFRCDADVYAVGGVLYMDGEAAGEPPYAELMRGQVSGEATLQYLTEQSFGKTAALTIGIADGVVAYWHIQDHMEVEHGGI